MAQQRGRSSGFGGAVALGLVLLAFVALAAMMVTMPDKSITVIALAVGLTVALAVIRWPVVGTYLTATLTILFDAEPSTFVHTLISDMGIFRNLSYRGLPDFVVVSLFEILVFLSLGSALVHRFHARQKLVRGPLFGPLMAYAAIVTWGEINGLLTGGDFKISLWELRPLLYVVALYILAVNTVKEAKHIRVFLYVTVATIILRCVEGISRYFTMTPDVRAIASVVLEHDDSLFLALVFGMLLAVYLWRDRLPKQLLWTLVAMVPLSLYVIVLNHRRAAYLDMILMLATMVPFVWITLKTREARKKLVYLLVGTGLVMGAYVGAFWNSGSSIAEPAQAVRSIFQPDERDYLSNLYRDQENTNLQYTIGHSPIVGIGFGKEFDRIVQMVDLTQGWALQYYMPHNNMLWLWMRMGIIGFVIFWILVGAAVLMIAASVRLGVTRLRYLEAQERAEAAEKPARTLVRGLGGTGLGLRVVRLAPGEPVVAGRSSAFGPERSVRAEIRECVEFLVLAFVAMGVVASLLGLAVVDQGLMSFRLAAYWGLVLGTLSAAWEMYRVKFALPAEVQLEEVVTVEDPSAANRRRVRLIAGPGSAS